MPSSSLVDDVRVERRDFYAVLGAEPSASVAELRAAFREAVLRHHPDRSADDSLATRRTSVLNRAWGELRDPVRRLHYDNDLERGRAATLAWPLEPDEAAAPTRRPRLAARPARTRWHTPGVAQRAGVPRPDPGLHGRPRCPTGVDRDQSHRR